MDVPDDPIRAARRRTPAESSGEGGVKALKLAKGTPVPPEPPLDRGRLMNAKQVAAELFNGQVSAAWVRRNLPGKIVLGHSTVVWREYDVRDWITQRGSAA